MAERKIRVGVSGHDLKFWNPIQAALEATGLYEFRQDVWSNHDVHDPAVSESLLLWADILVAEWALGNAVYYARFKFPHQKLIIRLHLQERGTTFPEQINYENVDQIVFVGPHTMRECIEKFSIPPAICSVLGNFVDFEKYDKQKLDGAEFTLGIIGTVPSRKRLDRALDTLELLVRKDDRYVLRVKGTSPASIPWLWERSAESDYYHAQYSRINSGNLRHRVIFDPQGNDVEHWLRMVGTLLSPSDFESFHMAVAEGAASGALPVVWNWEGAGEIYPGLSLVQDAHEAAEQVDAFARGKVDREYLEKLKGSIRSLYDAEAILDAWLELLGASVPVRNGSSDEDRSLRNRMRRHWPRRKPSFQHGKGSKALKDLKVALVCDEFTYNSFKYEFVPLVLEPDNWREVLDREKPDIFFCESAWSGVDSVRRPWKGRVYSSINFKRENRQELLAILEYCREKCIPTVFWNKEDPSHYEDKVHNFVDTAKLFDVVFTTDIDCVDRYKTEHGLKKVYCLPFATQPRIFNPIETGERSASVVFAGSWYAYHEARCAAMDQVFKGVLDSGLELEIYDRHHGNQDANHVFPASYRSLTKPAVPHSEIDRVYKSSLFGLNFNTEFKSPTMFARRVFELMSCNTLCLSNYSYGMERMFGDDVVFVDRDPQALRALTREQIDAKRERALLNVLRHHTYTERFKTIAQAVGVPFTDREAGLTVVCLVDSVEAAECAIAYFRRQTVAAQGAKLLLALDRAIPDIQIKEYYEAYNRLGVTAISVSCLEAHAGRPVSTIETEYVALMDQGRKVSPSYIADAFLHASYTGDAIVVIGQGDKYRYADEALVRDVIAGSSFFPLLLGHCGRQLKSKFYSV